MWAPGVVTIPIFYMAAKPETRRQRKIRKGLEKEFPDSWWKKIHGGWFQDAGIPDLIGCVCGLFFGFEVKEPDGDLSAIQIENIDDIEDAGGVACEVITLEQAIEIVYETLRKTGRLPKKGRKNRH
jgi:hypothetical protein